MKSIRTKIIIIIAIFTAIITASLGVLSYRNAQIAITGEAKEGLQLVTTESAKLVASEVNAQMTFLITAAQNSVLDSFSTVMKLDYLGAEAERTGYQVLGLADLNGDSLRSDGLQLNIADREYFTLAKEGTPNVSDVLIDKIDGKPIIVYAVPVIRDEMVTGVLYGVRDGEELSRYTNEIVFGQTGYAYIIMEDIC